MPSDWFNPCGVPYRTWEDGRIEVQGLGFPAWDVAGVRGDQLRTLWGRWGAAIQNAADINQIPAAWLVGIMQIESGGNPTVCSEANACGLMQFIPMTCRMYGHPDCSFYNDNPEQQIIDAGNLIKKNAAGHGGCLLSGVKAYNGGSPCTDTGMAASPGILGMYGQNDYVANFVRASNTFVALGLAPPAAVGVGGGTEAAVIFFVLGAVGYMWADIRYGLTNKILRSLR